MQTIGAQASPNALPLLNLSREASALSAFPLSAGSHPSKQWPAKRRAVDSDLPLSAVLHGTPWHPIAYQGDKLRVP